MENPLLLPDEIRWLTVAGALILLGAAGLIGGLSGAEYLGPLLILCGSVVLVAQFEKVGRRWQLERARQRLAAQRSVARQARRDRVFKERERRRVERAAAAEAILRNAETRSLHRQANARQVHETATMIAQRERAVTAETARILSLSDSELIAEVADIFVHRGLQVDCQAAGAECDLLLTTSEGSHHDVARCVPGRATSSDVQALELWREQAVAEHAYLIATSGFTPGAVRLSQDLQLTLVEAHLLAHWKIYRQDEQD